MSSEGAVGPQTQVAEAALAEGVEARRTAAGTAVLERAGARVDVELKCAAARLARSKDTRPAFLG